MLTLNGVNFVSENISLLRRCLFSKSGFFLCVSHNARKEKKNCHGICGTIRYFRLKGGCCCYPFLNSLSRECLPEWIMKHPPCCNIHVKLIYQLQSCRNIHVKLCKLYFKSLPYKADFNIFHLRAIWRSLILPYYIMFSVCTLHLIDNISEQIIFRSFMLKLPVSEFVRLITTSINTLKKQTDILK